MTSLQSYDISKQYRKCKIQIRVKCLNIKSISQKYKHSLKFLAKIVAFSTQRTISDRRISLCPHLFITVFVACARDAELPTWTTSCCLAWRSRRSHSTWRASSSSITARRPPTTATSTAPYSSTSRTSRTLDSSDGNNINSLNKYHVVKCNTKVLNCIMHI